MDITKVYKRFINTLIDKYGDASVEDFEFTELFNRAALSVLSDQFNNKNKRGENGILAYAFEMSQTDLHRWHTLIEEVEVVTDINGKVGYGAIEQALQDSNGSVFHINTPLVYVESIGRFKKARYVRHNDYAQILDNAFLKPTDKKPIWRGFDDYIQINPEGERECTFTVTRYPKKVVLDTITPSNNVDTDLTEIAVNDVMVRMEQYFAIKIRETQLYETASNQETKQ